MSMSALQAWKYKREIDIWIGYSWNFANDTGEEFGLQYSLLFAGIEELLDQSQFIIDYIEDETANKNDLVYVEEFNLTETLHIEMNIKSDSYDIDDEPAENLETYVKDELADDIIMKYDHTELTEGLLNIIYVQCNINKPSMNAEEIGILLFLLIFGSVIICFMCAICFYCIPGKIKEYCNELKGAN